MNRIEFMTELAALLQDVPEEERRDAMQFYNDYFDDAGVDKEEEVISELESPGRVAGKIKADLLGQKDTGEYTETGYQESGGYKKNVPAAGEERQNRQEQFRDSEEKGPWTSNVLKIILIAAIIFIGAPVIIPCALAIIAVVAAGIIALFCFFFAIVLCFVALAIVGVVLVVAGFVALIPEIAVGLALIGTGLILGVIGTVGTVAGVKLCIVMIPGICRGIVWVCRKPFHRRAVA